jgi:hypothetical protein
MDTKPKMLRFRFTDASSQIIAESVLSVAIYSMNKVVGRIGFLLATF